MKALELASLTVKHILEWNRRTMDAIAAPVYYYYALLHELNGRLADARPYVDRIILDANFP
jgi:26S proteasome regulatory subunit N3